MTSTLGALVLRYTMAFYTILLFDIVTGRAYPQQTSFNVLHEYKHHGIRDRINTPEDQINRLRRHELSDALTNFPASAIILYRNGVEKYLDKLGFGGFYSSFSYGFTYPIMVYVVRKPGVQPFAVAPGLPGAGELQLKPLTCTLWERM